jgi:transposase
VFAWRKRYRNGGSAMAAAPRLVPVMVTPDRDAAAIQLSPATETIEIELGGYRVRVGSAVDAQALRRVLDVLERR